VTLNHVHACKQKFIKNMEDEVKGHQVETCFGPGGCPNRAVEDSDLVRDLEDLLASKNLRAFLKESVNGPLKLHHEFRVSMSDCPNLASAQTDLPYWPPSGSFQQNATRCGAA
jgi:hypothetical protein